MTATTKRSYFDNSIKLPCETNGINYLATSGLKMQQYFDEIIFKQNKWHIFSNGLIVYNSYLLLEC